MSIFSNVANGVGGVLVALAIPVAILAVGIPVAFIIGMILKLTGLS